MLNNEQLHVYSNGTDVIFGESAEEALTAYCNEVGESPCDYPGGTGAFKCLKHDALITVNDDGEHITMTAEQWVTRNMTGGSCGYVSRLICSTEF
jgi:hypothetical protein